MKCVIFCGGKGTRLFEETEFKPKPLVEIGGKPILWHIMKHYGNYGINDFILPIGYKGEMIKRFFLEYHWRNNDFSINLKDNSIITYDNQSIEDWKITCVDTGIESKTALRLFRVKKFLENEEIFCMTYGDGLSNINLTELIAFHKKHKKLITITCPHPRSKYGLIETNPDNLVINFQEKPILHDVINGGFMVVNKEIFSYLTEKNEMIEDVLIKIAAQNEVMAYHFNGFWHSMDTYQDFQELNHLWEKEKSWQIFMEK